MDIWKSFTTLTPKSKSKVLCKKNNVCQSRLKFYELNAKIWVNYYLYKFVTNIISYLQCYF